MKIEGRSYGDEVASEGEEGKGREDGDGGMKQ